ncbi:MAG: EamA family transporter [Chloroflexota bacterium]|nr:EamA family transporter [Chloroflexota bacterium]
MPPAALALVFVAAALHAAWNLLAKRGEGHPVFFWLALAIASVLYLPAFVVGVILEPIPTGGWGWIAATGVLHAAYFWSLANAYARADLSVTYPLARGLGPTLVLVVSVWLVGESVSGIGLAGVLTVIAGIYVLNLRSLHLRSMLDPLRMLLRPGGRYAAFTGVLIASYTLVDKQGVAVVNPLTYVYLMWLIAAGILTPVVLAQYGARPWRRVSVSWRDVTLVAILCVAAYLLVLIALTMAPAPYVSAAREVSILIGAALGMTLLREPRTAPRFVGAGAIALGAGLVALA